MSIRRATEWLLWAVWFSAVSGDLVWFLKFGGYLTVYHLCFFVSGLGLGLIARHLLVPEAALAGRQAENKQATVEPENVVKFQEAH